MVRHETTGQAGTEAGTVPAEFALVPLVGERIPAWLELSRDEHDALKAARAMIQVAIAIEDKLWIVAENYLDYEREVVGLALGKSVRRDFAWHTFQGEAVAIERRLSNLLSSVRGYLDHLVRQVRRCHGVERRREVEAFANAEYDRSLAYRVMEALRNVTQHKARGVSGLFFEHRSQQAGSVLQVVPKLHVTELRAAKAKRRVIDELAAIGESHDLTPFVQAYVSGIGRIHKSTRDLLSPAVNAACDLMLSWADRGHLLWDKPGGFEVGRLRRGQDLGEPFQVFRELPVYCRSLMTQPLALEGAGLYRVSTQAVGRDRCGTPVAGAAGE